MIEALSLAPGLALALSALLGALVGSYLNVVIYRVPRGRSTLRPRSKCPGCNQPIAWYDNVPVLSYLVLRGRCRRCRQALSMRYPIVEATTSALFALATFHFGLSITTLIAWLFLSLLLSLALIDFDHLLLPDALTLPGLVLGLLLSTVSDLTGPLSAGLGAFLGGFVLLAIIGLYLLLRGEFGMGLGDPKMLAMIGAFLGLSKTVVTLFVASLVGSLVSLLLILARRADGRSKLPFGVYLALGAAVALFFGDSLVHWYISGWSF